MRLSWVRGSKGGVDGLGWCEGVLGVLVVSSVLLVVMIVAIHSVLKCTGWSVLYVHEASQVTRVHSCAR